MAMWRLLLLAVTFAACSPETSRKGVGPPVIMICLDTFRADHMSSQGYGVETTPRLDAFVDSATAYPFARAASPWTQHSHASMYTGLYPREHGARTYDTADFSDVTEVTTNAAALSTDHLTLAEVFTELGYDTCAVIANESFLAPKYGLAQGFGRYDCKFEWVQGINARALAWVKEHKQGPFFLFLNYMDTHRPYNTTGREGFDIRKTKGVFKQLKDYLAKGEAPPAKKVKRLTDVYDLAMANLDEGLGELFDSLVEMGIYDEALIILTADHGEYLGEHSLVGHSKDVYDEALGVPLAVKLPGQSKGARRNGWISHVHLAELVLRSAGFEERARVFRRAGNADGEVIVSENYGLRQLDLGEPWAAWLDRKRMALFKDHYKYVASPDDGQHELYDLDADPRELENLIEKRPDLAARFSAELEAWLSAHPERRATGLIEMGPHDWEVFRALGYAGGDDE